MLPHTSHVSLVESVSPFAFLTRKEERKERKELEKLRLREQQEEFVRQQQAAQAAREAAAVEDLRRKIVSRIRELQGAASAANATITKIRRLAAEKLLEDDPFLQDLEAQLADMETGVVQVQSGTVVDVASNDTHVLAVSYADAQGALIAIHAVRSRASGLLNELRNHLDELQADAIRAEQRRRRQALEAEQERQRQAKLAARRAEARERHARRARMDQQLENMRILSEIETQIVRERAAIRQARYELNSLRSARAGQPA